MNALAARDALFSGLRSAVLKEAGFRKRGHWATRAKADTIQRVYLRASRFGDQASASFWIDIQVFHAGWCELLFVKDHAVPLLLQCSTLCGVLDHYCEQNEPGATRLAAAGVCFLLGEHELARKHMQTALRRPPHESQRQWLVQREKSMWSALPSTPH